MALAWETHRDLLKELWLTQDKTYDQVRLEMKRLQNFNASKSQYEKQFKKWGWRKNISNNEWRLVNKALIRRKEEGRGSAVYFNNMRISDARVKKEISRHVQPSYNFMPVASPPDSHFIEIRTPPPTILDDAPAAVEHLRTTNSTVVQMKRKRSIEHVLEPSGSKKLCTLVHQSAPNATEDFHPTHLIVNQSTVEADNLPFFEFLRLFESLNRDAPLLQGDFFDLAPSPSILPSDPLSSVIIEQSDWNLDVDVNNPWFESTGECSTIQRSMGRFYKSFAHILIPCNAGTEDQDQLDANKDIQERLPKILANMPERSAGERQSVIQTLLGPPQLSAALCLLEVAVYLFSNNYIDIRYSENNPILQWIVDTVPFPNLSTILRTRLPTLQAFQNALLVHGIQTGNIFFVRKLLDLGTGLQDWVYSSPNALEAAVRAGNFETVKVILDICSKNKSNLFRHSWLSLERGFSAQIAQLFVEAGVKIHEPVYSRYTIRWPLKQTPLITAISRGDNDLAQYLISVGADVNLGHEWSDAEYTVITPLRLAVAIGRVDILVLLLENHADVHAVSECGDFKYSIGCLSTLEPSQSFTATAFQAAAFSGNIDMVVLLLKAGSNINERAHGNDGQTALYAATNAGQVPMVEFLIQSGADINAPGCSSTDFPRPALLIAVERNNYTLVELLLNLGADPNVPAFGYDGTALLEAARNENVDVRIASLLLAKGAEDRIRFDDLDRTQYMRHQLLQAIGRGDSGRVHHLLDIGAKVDMEPMIYSDLDQTKLLWWDQKTPMSQVTMLHLAIAIKRVDSSLFSYLLKHAKSNELDYNGSLEPLLHHAVGRRRVDFVQALLDAGVNINAVSLSSQFSRYDYYKCPVPTALNIASAQGDVDIVSLLLDKGADIELRLPGADTPLQASLNLPRPIEPKNLDVFELLLSRDADINATPASPKGSSALQCAIKASGVSDLKTRAISLVQRLLNLGARVNAPPAEVSGQTALQAACETGNLDLVLLLLDHGAGINAPTAKVDGGTALQYAARMGHIKVAQLLLNRGAEVNAPGSPPFGTALECAAMRGRLDMAQILINAGADHNIPLRKRYVSALQQAKAINKSGVESLLQKYRGEAIDEWNKTRVEEAESDESVEEDSDQSENDYEDDSESASGTDTDEMNDEN